MILSDTFSTPQFPCCSFLKIRVVPCDFGEADRIKNLAQLGGVGGSLVESLIRNQYVADSIPACSSEHQKKGG